MHKEQLLNYFDYLVSWIQDEVKKANLKGVVIGMSGGVDSSLVAALAKKAFPDNSLGVFMPINNMGSDLEDAKLVASNIKINTINIDLTNAFEQLLKTTNVKQKLSIANIKPRIRMTALYAIAQENKYLVLGTDNAAEWALGYFTKYGDGGVDILPIIHLSKTQVKLMSEYIGLPKITYTKKPSAGLWENQTDEQELGFSYDEVDKYLAGEKIAEDIKQKIEKQIALTKHKRKPLPIPRKILHITK